MSKISKYALILLMVLSIAKYAEATPLFSMQAAEKCDTCHEMPDSSDPRWAEENFKISERKCRLSCGVCHVNPSGGMLRNDAGFLFGASTLPWKAIIPEEFRSAMESVKPGEHLTVGGDFRFLLLSREDSSTNPLFFPMQADLYANADLGKHLSVLTQIGMERGGNSAVREAAGMLKNFPYNSYLKAGKFVPPYGHRLEDHTAFVRDKLGLNHSRPEDYVSGYEIGAEPILLYARFSQFNADTTPQTGAGTKTAQGFSGETGWRGLWLHLGLSYMDVDNEATSFGIVDRSSYGLFGAVRPKWFPYLDRLTYLFEFDRRKDLEGSGIDAEANITFNELDYRVAKGANIKLRYETYDPDKAASDNILLKRYVAGVDLYPIPFAEVNIQYRLNREEDKKEIDEFLLLGHIWF